VRAQIRPGTEGRPRIRPETEGREGAGGRQRRRRKEGGPVGVFFLPCFHPLLEAGYFASWRSLLYTVQNNRCLSPFALPRWTQSKGADICSNCQTKNSTPLVPCLLTISFTFPSLILSTHTASMSLSLG
jgi:hypothetical protein